MNKFTDRGEPITFDVSEMFKPVFERYRQEGYQAGLKHGAAIANPIEGIIPRNQWMKGYQTGREEAQQAILREIKDE